MQLDAPHRRCFSSSQTLRVLTHDQIVRRGRRLVGVLVLLVAASTSFVHASGPTYLPFVWGSNSVGQLGSAPVYDLTPTPVSGFGSGSGALSISVSLAGYDLTVKADGSLWAWGNNQFGQLGDGTRTTRLTPIRVMDPSDGTGFLTNVVAAAGSSSFQTIALKSNGAVVEWGQTTTNVFPSQVSGLGPGSGVVAVAIGSERLALKADGTVLSWGVFSSLPTAVSGLGPGSGVIAISAGSFFSLALKSDGTVMAWGMNNSSGQLGDGTTVGKSNPVQVSGLGAGSGVVKIAAGNNYGLALKSDGSVVAWGNNQSGQLGDGTTTTRLTPVSVAGLGSGSGVSGVAAGSSTSLAVKSDGGALGWGFLPDGVHTTTVPISDPADPSGLLSGVTAVAAGAINSLALKNNGAVLSWGINSNGEGGHGTINASPLPLAVPGLAHIAVSSGGLNHSVATKSDGSVVAWGRNTLGALGDGTLADHFVPAQVSGFGPGSDVNAVSSGNNYSLVAKSDGKVWAWGNNSNGQLGDGSTTTRLVPVQVHHPADPTGFLSDVTGVAASKNGFHSLAVKTDGSVWTWGFNSNGQLGDGTTTQRLTPVQVGGLGPGSGVVAGAISSAHSLALKADGTVWAWGQNFFGQLGDGTITQRLTPVQVSGLNGVVAVAAGAGYSLALKADGTVVAWGVNASGQLGDGTRTDRALPAAVSGLGPGSGVVGVGLGPSQSFAWTNDGTLWAWGNNAVGQLGDNSLVQRTSPVQIAGSGPGARVVFVDGGGTHSLALVADDVAPVLTLPSTITTEATGPSGATVTYAASGLDAIDGAVPVTCAPASGFVFPLGTTPVDCSATDSSGNTATGSFSVVVQDSTPPAIAITSPANGATYALGQTVIASYVCTDTVGVASCAGPVANGAAVGTSSPGTFTFTVNASDAAGNVSNASTTYTVSAGAPAASLEVLYHFEESDGHSQSSLVEANGKLYGTTTGSGIFNRGSVFVLEPVSGGFVRRTLHSFNGCSNPGLAGTCDPHDGAFPYAGLVKGGDGSFYGTTIAGGANNVGTIFKVNAGGTLAIVHEFSSIDGASPAAALVRARDGSFYATASAGGTNGVGTVVRLDGAGHVTTLASFHQDDGANPSSILIQGTDDNFYGTTRYGGAEGNAGTIFKVDASGTLTSLFGFTATPGGQPYGGVIQATDGSLYGTTESGGGGNGGTVFRFDGAGVLTTLHEFNNANGEGKDPIGGLLQASDGSLYGTTFLSSSAFGGAIFRVDLDGAFTVMHTFVGGEGAGPFASLMQGSDGKLYGTTYYGGAHGFGTVFRLTLNSSSDTVAPTIGDVSDITVEATSPNGAIVAFPSPSVTDDTDPGPTVVVSPVSGSQFALGTTVVTVTATDASGNVSAKSFSVIVRDTQPPAIAITSPTNGATYAFGQTVIASYLCSDAVGVASCAGPVANGVSINTSSPGTFTFTVNASDAAAHASSTSTTYTVMSGTAGPATFEVLHSFSESDGPTPFSNITSLGTMVEHNGKLYGTTTYGGANGEGYYGWGSIFTLEPIPGAGGSFHTVHSFDRTDGGYPGGLVRGGDGIYGTTFFGGAFDLGTIFKLNDGGTLTTLHNFRGYDGVNPAADGSYPSNYQTLLKARNGSLYGTTTTGGIVNSGTIYKLGAAGAVTILHEFTGIDGAAPYATLVQGADDNLYGTTYFGGAGNFGTIFKLGLDGTLTTLHSFDNVDGAWPIAGLAQGSDGAWYGGTCGGAGALGTLFRLDATGTLTTLHRFTDSCVWGLIRGNDGNFYGTTALTIFRLTPAGTVTTLHGFTPSTDGVDARSTLLQGSDGNLYGTTIGGGVNEKGTVFRLTLNTPSDTVAPTIGDLSDITVEATSPSGAIVNFLPPSVTDDTDPAPTVVVSPAPGSQFALGTTVVTVTATDASGNVSTGSFSVIVRDTLAPAISIASPINNATYIVGQLVTADYSCADPSGVASCSGTVANGAFVDTSTVGAFTFTVTSSDSLGNAALVDVHYNVVEPPHITIISPSDVIYTLGSLVSVQYSCGTAATCIGDVPTGTALDTSVPGFHTFTVIATDALGNSTVAMVTYAVSLGACVAPPGGMTAWLTGNGTAVDGVSGAFALWSGDEAYAASRVQQGFAVSPGHNVSFPLAQAGPFTVQAWVSTPNSAQPEGTGILATAGSGQNATSLQFDLDGFGNYRLTVGDNELSVLIGPATNVPQHVAVAFDGTMVTTYLNGQAIESDVWMGSPGLGLQMLLLGLDRDGIRPFTGVIGQAQAFNRALTADEIRQTFLSGEAGLCLNQPPIAIATATPNPVEATSPAGAMVTLDGTASSDPDGDALYYTWTEGMTTLGTGNMLAVQLSLGPHTISLTVDDGHGHVALTDVVVLVRDTTPPAIAITTPPASATYLVFQPVVAAYSCLDLVGVASCAGPVGNGDFIDTTTAGSFAFTVNAADATGNLATNSVSYTVVEPPHITITSPNDVIYARGSMVAVQYSCGTAATCVGDLPNGAPLDTSVPGFYTFTVTAADALGNSTVAMVTYAVSLGECVAPPDGMTAWLTGNGTAVDAVSGTFALWSGDEAYAPSRVQQGFAVSPGHSVSFPLAQAGPFTVEAWIATPTPGQPEGTGILSTGGPGQNTTSLQFDLDGFGNYRLTVGDNELSVLIGPATNVAQHLAVTFDGTMVTTYLNGEAIESDGWMGSPGLGLQVLLLGLDRDGTRAFTGVIGQVQAFNRALTANEIRQTFLSGDAGLCPNRPPIAVATATPNPAEATGSAGATVMLDGTGSSDPDGDALTYIWTEGTTTLGTGSTLAVPFSIGTHTVTLTVDDGRHASASSTVTVVVRDTAPPVLSGVPTDRVVEATGPMGAIVSWATPTAVDIVDGAVSVACVPASGSVFGFGVTNVTCSATDTYGNTSSTSFLVTVQDTTPPALSNVPSDITVEATFNGGAFVNWSLPTAIDIVDGIVPVTCTPPTGSGFAIQTSGVTCSATDAHGNTAQEVFAVIVRDTTPPVLSGVPTDRIIEATGPSGAVVSWIAPIATDIVDGTLPVTCAPASGSSFGFGLTVVTCSASDAHGNITSASFQVTVQDTTPPTLSNVPGPITVEATSNAGAFVSWSSPTATDLVDGVVPVTCAPPSGAGFAIQTSGVTCSATDAHGNKAQEVFTVMVRDTTPPLLIGEPTDITVEATGPGGTIVSWAMPTALDLIDGAVAVSCNVPSGSMFPLGATTVRCSATDSHGNTAFCLFVVTVRDTIRPIVQITSPSTDALLTGSSIDVIVQASDIVGMNGVAVNGVAATRISGSPQVGTWRATVPIALPVAPGAALTFDAVGVDASGNAAAVQLVVDNDGIPSALDRGRTSGTDQTAVYSSDFNNFVTAGTIVRNGWTAVVSNQGTAGTVRAQISGAGTSPARFGVCGGVTKEIRLRGAGDIADATCSSPTGTLTARAVSARPWIEVWKQQSPSTWLTTLVPSGSTFTTGSPATASLENTAPIDVQVVHVDSAGASSVVGGFRLAPGESVDVAVTPGVAGSGDAVRFNVLRGRVVVSLSGQTRMVIAGESTTMTIDRTPARKVFERVLDELTGLGRLATRKGDRDRLEDAMKSLSDVVDTKRWLDGDHVRRQDGDRIFDRIGRAAGALEALANEREILVDRETVIALVARLTAASQLIAVASLGDAVMQGGEVKGIAGAQVKLSEADARGERDRQTIDRYYAVWKELEGR